MRRSARRQQNRVRLGVAGLLVIGAVGGGASALGRSNRGGSSAAARSAGRYVAAYVALAEERTIYVASTDRTVLKFGRQVGNQCRNVLLGGASVGKRGRGDFEMREIEEEMDGALETVASKDTAKQMRQFAARIGRLQWPNREVSRLVSAFAIAARSVEHLPPVPDLCANMKAWAGTGFRRVPPATLRFNREFESTMHNPAVSGRGQIGGAVRRAIAPYTNPRSLAALVRAERQVIKDLTDEEDTWSRARYVLFRLSGLRTPVVN